jgi:RNA polymerase-binding transcription factor
VNLDHYKDLLLARERELTARQRLTSAAEQEPGDGAAGDIGDESVRDEQKSKLFSEGEADTAVLDEVRLALGRIADGTYGLCLVDGQPIPEPRLEAVPWARYCAKHQAELEQRQNLRTPTA